MKVELKNRDMLYVLSSLGRKSGKIFSVKFTKVNGEERQIVGRFGVTKHLKGGVRTALPQDWVVYSIQDKGYRTVKPDAIKSIKYSGVEYIFNK